MHAFGPALLPHWPLDPGWTYLNHGAFGVVPRAVLAAQIEWRDRIERQPSRFMTDEIHPRLREAADGLGAFLGVDGAQIGFVDNATTAINAVLQSIAWRVGDEIVIGSVSYPGVRQAVAATAERTGVVIREAALAVPVASGAAIVDGFVAAFSPRTRLVVVDHVSSQLGIVLPVADIAAAARRRGIAVCVDGAHAPGMLELDITALGVDWYAANCYKWLHAPRGCGFLWTSRDWLDRTHPAITSVWRNAGYAKSFDWQGTRDPSAWLCVTAGIAFFEMLGGTVAQDYQHGLAATAARMLSAQWRVPLTAPLAMHAAMVALPLPGPGGRTDDDAVRLRQVLRDRDRIEPSVQAMDGRLWVRGCAQVYNALPDFERLGDAVLRALADTG